jgi:hypothetical protein
MAHTSAFVSCAVAAAIVAGCSASSSEEADPVADDESELGACGPDRDLNVVAHEDDDLLFMNPDIARAIRDGSCSRTLFLTAGDAGEDETYWRGREQGILRAYAIMSGSRDAWRAKTVRVRGRTLSGYALSSRRGVEVVFMRLPDGYSGEGTTRYGSQSLEKLWNETETEITSVDGSLRSMALRSTRARSS